MMHILKLVVAEKYIKTNKMQVNTNEFIASVVSLTGTNKTGLTSHQIPETVSQAVRLKTQNRMN